MEYDNKGRVVLFPKNKKAENHPDFTGTLTDLDGKEWDIALWKKRSRNGLDYLNGKISPPYNPQGKGQEGDQEGFSDDYDAPW